MGHIHCRGIVEYSGKDHRVDRIGFPMTRSVDCMQDLWESVEM